MILFIIKSIEVIAIKTYYIEKMDKHKIIGRKIQFENDNIKIYMDLEKGKNTRKLVKRLLLNETNNVVIDKELITCEKLINLLRANDIKIFDGKWLEKYLILDILEYIINKKQIIKAIGIKLCMQPFWLLFLCSFFKKKVIRLSRSCPLNSKNNIGGKKEYAKEDCESI